MVWYGIVYDTIVYVTILYYTILYYTVLYYTPSLRYKIPVFSDPDPGKS